MMPLRLLSPWTLLPAIRVCCFALVVLILPSMVQAGLFGKDAFLPPEQAFQVEGQVNDVGQVTLVWTAAPQHYLYKEKFAVSAVPAGITVGPLVLPTGDRHFDEALGKDVESFRGDVSSQLDLPTALPPSQAAWLKVVYQGCADAGLCYPPQTHFFQLTVNAQGQIVGIASSDEPTATGSTPALRSAGNTAASTSTSNATASTTDDNAVSRALASGNLLHVALVCLLAGLLLSLTPCVWPMLPILSSIIVGQKTRVSRHRGFLLALVYSQGMALVYTLLGVAAGLLGQGLAAYLQHPWVLLGFACAMVLLALSMFGLYELQLPHHLQNWLSQGAQRLPGGQFLSVFLMGALSALVVSPCVSAPLAGALLYIGQTGNMWLGATALYAMAWGMSVPLLLVGLSMGSLLPRAGSWMTGIKALCGILILALAVWMVRPAWPFLKAQVTGQAITASGHVSVLPFQRVRSNAELDAALAQATREGKVVMLDFYADWCVACLELEHNTFKDPRIQQSLQTARLLQVDVTAHNAADRALLKRFDLFGPPGILFFDPKAANPGQAKVRVIGYQAPERFLQALQAAGLPTPP